MTPLAAEGLYFCFSSSALRLARLALYYRLLLWPLLVLFDGLRMKFGVFLSFFFFYRRDGAADGVRANLTAD